MSGLVAILILLGCTGQKAVENSNQDFARWTEVGGPVWQLESSAASAGPSETAGYLVSPDSYRDLRLRVEFWIEDETNSGIFVRCSDPSTIAGINPTSCYEINIWDNHPNQEFRTGSVVTLAPPEQEVHTLGKWNTYEITVQGSSIEVTLNGVQTVSISDDKLTFGPVALQYMGGGKLRFRNLTIEEL